MFQVQKSVGLWDSFGESRVLARCEKQSVNETGFQLIQIGKCRSIPIHLAE